MMRLIVMRAVSAEDARPRGMSEYKIETLPWPVCFKTFGLFEGDEELRRVKKDRHSVSLRRPEATKRTPLGAESTWERGDVTSSCRVGFESWLTEEGSPAEAMMHPRGGE